jgi:hypothetical protein
MEASPAQAGEDRQYVYLAKTFDAPSLTLEDFTAAMEARVLPHWRRLFERGWLRSVQMLHKVGDIDLQTAAGSVRDWQYFLLAELGRGVEAAQVAEEETQAGISPAKLDGAGIDYLSSEILSRPADAGTAIPAPSRRFSAPPRDQLAAIEYIQIPPQHWDEYRRFMKEVMGPVGAHMVKVGRSYQVQILEQIAVLHRSDSLPPWNRIHILWGRFDDPQRGFFQHTNEAIREVLGRGIDVQAALDPVNRYRIKPRMSKNQRVEALCL